MKKFIQKRKKELIVGLGIFLISLCLIGIYNCSHSVLKTSTTSPLALLDYDTTDHVYLSDIEYEKDQTFVEPGYYLRLDKNNSSGLISLKVNGENTQFIKGIAAWATSEVVYDLSKLPTSYDKFTAYLGVDLSQNSSYYNGGVTFYIYTSTDGITWDQKLKTDSMRNLPDSIPNAIKAEVDIKGAKYLKLYAYENGDSWYSQWYDDAVYADAKLVKDSYVEPSNTNDTVLPLASYDTTVNSLYGKCSENNCSPEEQQTYKLALLRRTFVNNVGYDILQALMRYSNEYVTIMNWLMNDADTLELFLMGGAPDGNYVSALKILNELYNKYQADFKDSSMTSLGNKTKGELYKEMVVTLSLTHSANVGLWVTGAPEDPLDPNGSYAINRYAIFKKLYNDNKLDNNIFENLSVEEMRFVMNNIIDDEEIMWLNDFVKVNDSTDPYRYIKYTFDYNYGKSEYYDLARKSEWDNKTRSNLTRPYLFTTKYQDANGKDYEITYGDKAKLWIVFEEGSVCGGLSKTGSNIWGSKGVPSSVIGQPGHAAYIYMALDAKGNKHWNLGNNVSGWGQSGKTEKLAVRMPNGWGTGSYIGSYPASYILLAQAALSDYDKYVASEEIIMAADVYEGNNTLLDNIYEQALKVQSINFDAWYGLVNLYIAKNASEEELLALANRIVDNLVYYPLPMHDLLRIIRDNIETEANKAVIINTITEALKRAQKTTSEEYYQASATVAVANYLLSTHKPVASFSFDGENANKIVLSDDFKNTETNWQYNLVSALPSDEANWHDATGLSHELTAEEIALIHEETDIHIRIIGANETIYDINIDKSATPLNVGSNDNENTLTGTNETMEWKLDGENTWTSFKDKEPNLEGNVSLSVRVGYTANKLASDPVTVEFTDEDSNIIKTYIKTSKLSVVDASSEETVRENNSKDNVLDGKKNTMWHTLWNGSDTEKYITLKIDEPSYITALEYVPRVNSTNGIVKEAKIEVSNDGSTWETVETTEALTWNLDNTPKMATFTKPVEATYIKLTGVKTEGNYMSASMINLFEDMTKKIPVTADIEYSTKDLTNKNVTATLTNGNRNFSVSNSNGEKSHTFTKNGNYTFEIVDDYGNTNKVTATVTWIDKDKPVGKISYSTKSKTTDKVTAILSCDEDIIITNNDGKNTYTFDKNGSFEFTYQDKAGNTNKTTAKVTWIEETKEDNITTNDNPDYNDNNYYESNNNSSNNNTYNGSYSTNQETNSNSNDNNITNNTLDNNTSTNNDDTTNSDIKNESEDNNLNENEEIKTDNDENTIIEKESNNSKNNNPVLIVSAVALISAGSITIITMIKKRK